MKSIYGVGVVITCHWVKTFDSCCATSALGDDDYYASCVQAFNPLELDENDICTHGDSLSAQRTLKVVETLSCVAVMRRLGCFLPIFAAF